MDIDTLEQYFEYLKNTLSYNDWLPIMGKQIIYEELAKTLNFQIFFDSSNREYPWHYGVNANGVILFEEERHSTWEWAFIKAVKKCFNHR